MVLHSGFIPGRGALLYYPKAVPRQQPGVGWCGCRRDYTISSDKQATVQSIHVVQGQAIRAGDTLVQLVSMKLVQDMTKLDSKVQTLESEKVDKKKLSASEIELIRSAHAIEINNLKKEIAEAESELRLNKEITGDLKLNSARRRAAPWKKK